MKIGAFQFNAAGNLRENHLKIVHAINMAHRKHVRLLVFQECATCSYLPVERPDVEGMVFHALEENLKQIQRLAARYSMYIAIGTIRQKTAGAVVPFKLSAQPAFDGHL